MGNSIDSNDLLQRLPQAVFLYSKDLDLIHCNNAAKSILDGELKEKWNNWIKKEGVTFLISEDQQRVTNDIDLQLPLIILSRFHRPASSHFSVQIFKETAAEEKYLENDKVHCDKLFALKHLSSSIAHHINNPLSIIMGYNEMIAYRMAENHPLPKLQFYLDEQKKAVKRIAHVTQLLSIFSIQENWQQGETDIHDCLNFVIEKLNNRLNNKNIQIKLSLCDLPIIVKSSATPLKQALEQILLNAKEIAASTKDQLAENKIINIKTLHKKGFGRIVIDIKGRGLSKLTLLNIFNPFYSTKETGENLGLGLSVAHSIIENLGGKLLVQSFLKQRTCFEICIPLRNQITIDQNCHANPKVLLVGERVEIQNNLIHHLQELNFDVECTPNASLAIERLQQNFYEIVIADFFLPEMDGSIFLEKIKNISHILESQIFFLEPDYFDYSEEKINKVKNECNGFIGKLFGQQELSKILTNKK